VLSWLEWLSALPAPLLYVVIAVAACLENIFPPLPADTVVALGAFVSARGDGTALGAWTATMVGNIGGAIAMFFVGRRVGMRWLSARYPTLFPEVAVSQIAVRFKQRGMWAMAVSRLLPAVRALVPPVAGALGYGVGRTVIAMASASAIWYGIVCVVAFRAGANADAVLARIAEQQRVVMIGAALIVSGVIAVVLWRRRARTAK
jgi:membrane protein DedA with SNARE-associated domain